MSGRLDAFELSILIRRVYLRRESSFTWPIRQRAGVILWDFNRLIRTNELIHMGIEGWEFHRRSPGWVHDKYLVSEHYRLPDWHFDIAENVTVDAFFHSNADRYFISMMIDGEGAEPQELDMGLGSFLRPNTSGSLVMADGNLIKQMRGRGPYHAISSRQDGPYVRSRLETLWGLTTKEFEPLYRRAFVDEQVAFLLHQLLAIGRGAKSLLNAGEIVDLLLGRLLELAGANVDLSRTLGVPLRRASIQKALNYISRHYHRKMMRGELAAVAEMSDGHFARTFKLELGVSQMAYLKRFRLVRVHDLLRLQDGRSLGEIAKTCGFLNERSLYPCFEEVFGVAPGEIRGTS